MAQGTHALGVDRTPVPSCPGLGVRGLVPRATASKDREVKIPLYAHYGVAYAWLVDPRRRTREVHALDGRHRRPLAEASGDGIVAAAPFGELQLALSRLLG